MAATISSSGKPPLSWAKYRANFGAYWRSLGKDYRRQIAEVTSAHLPPNGSVLDLGCGIGASLFVLSILRPDVTCYGVDLNRDYCRMAAVLNPRAKIFHGTLPVERIKERGHFDVITSTFALAYLSIEAMVYLLNQFHEQTDAFVLAEPTAKIWTEILEFHGEIPYFGYGYREILSQLLHWPAIEIPIRHVDELGGLTVITVATRPHALPEPAQDTPRQAP